MKIKKLTITTANLKGQTDFYANTLQFRIIKQGLGFTEFQTGESILRFEAADSSIPYHFAFNIPSFQEQEALDWLESRVDILPYESDRIIPFDNWNAHAMYFYDPDNNIIEFIARKNLLITTDYAFSADSILGISEIGVPVKDINPIFNHLNKKLDLELYSGNLTRFSAIGDETGLLIVINQNEKDFWFPVNDPALAANFEAIISQDDQLHKIIFHNQNLYTHELKSNHHSFHEFA